MAEADLIFQPDQTAPWTVSAKITADITDVHLAYTWDGDPEKAKVASAGDAFLGMPLSKGTVGRGAVRFSRAGTLIGKCSEAIDIGDRVTLDDGGLWQKDAAGLYAAITSTTTSGQKFSFVRA
jgi:hypothetical protein